MGWPTWSGGEGRGSWRAIEISTNPGDIVLDSFAGSGTTAACALKMKRRWVIVEMGEHASSYAVSRLKKFVSGRDDGGISAETGWLGGSGFRFCTLARAAIRRGRRHLC
ncbi:MAG: site-specific DNA-methyltransferase [Pseudomonadota bacterium]|nr:site-specific DNA-methyltransferase [Pseudomonadota bacterium]